MDMPEFSRPTGAEHDVIAAARASRAQCACGETHDDQDAVTPATIARMTAYRAANPGHQFAIDEDGILGIIVASDSGPPQVLAAAHNLNDLLDTIGAPAAEGLSLPRHAVAGGWPDDYRCGYYVTGHRAAPESDRA